MNRKMLRLAASLVASAASALALEGCPPCGSNGAQAVGAWSFENCADAACGFTVESGTTRVTATFHPGEHGLDLAPGTSIVAPVSVTASTLYGMPFVKVLARCDAGSSLSVELGATSTSRDAAPDAGTTGEDETLRATIPTTTTWALANEQLVSTGQVRRLNSVRVIAAGAGHCQIDQLEVSVNFYGFCD